MVSIGEVDEVGLDLERLGKADRPADSVGVFPHALDRATDPAALSQQRQFIGTQEESSARGMAAAQ